MDTCLFRFFAELRQADCSSRRDNSAGGQSSGHFYLTFFTVPNAIKRIVKFRHPLPISTGFFY